MFRKFLFSLSLACLTVVSTGAESQPISIIATAGEEAVTTADLVNRTRLMVISSGMKPDEETARKIAPQVLQSLINERLQIQELTRLGIEISNEEVTNAINGIEQQNRMQPGQLTEILNAAKIPVSTLQNQVRGQIAWAKIRSSRIQPKIIVTEDEIDDFLNAQRLSPAENEYYINEIVLPVENSSDEIKTKELAEKLVSELESGKASFANVAKQFSQASSSQGGGEVGWLAENQVPKELMSEIRKGGTGKVLGPIRSIEGYFIIKASESRKFDNLADMHNIVLRQFEVLLKNAKPAEADKRIMSLTDSAAACADTANYAKSKNVMVEDYGNIQVRALQGPIKKIVSNLKTGEFSPVVDTGKSLIRFIVCEKTEYLPSNADTERRDKARQELVRRKVELESRKYLRDLRRSNNIEIK